MKSTRNGHQGTRGFIVRECTQSEIAEMRRPDDADTADIMPL